MSLDRCTNQVPRHRRVHLSRARDAGGATVGDQRRYRHDACWGQSLMHVMRVHERVRDVLRGRINGSYLARAWRS